MVDLDQLIQCYDCAQHARAIRYLARPCVRIKRTRVAQESLTPTDSRIGGLPHLPPDLAWPTQNGLPMSHIATIRLSEVEPFDTEQLLPKRGLLYFWYSAVQDVWGFDPKDAGGFRVDYLENESNRIELRRHPSAGCSGDQMEIGPETGVFHPARATFSTDWTLPNEEWIQDMVSPLRRLWTIRELANARCYGDLCDGLPADVSPADRLLGHPQAVQGPMEMECQLVTHGLYCGDATVYNDPRAAALARKRRDWRLLLQIDSDDDSGMCWGDAGRLYYWIPKAGLRARDFTRVWMILQCG